MTDSSRQTIVQMSLGPALGTILVCSILLAALDAMVGYSLGTFAPGYYRGVFQQRQDMAFAPVSVGVGLGLTQGMAGGVFVGLAVVALFCWREIQVNRSSVQLVQTKQPGQPISCASLLLFGAAAVFIGILGFSSGVLLGEIRGIMGGNHRRYLEERALIAPILASDPAFGGVKMNERSDGGVYLAG